MQPPLWEGVEVETRWLHFCSKRVSLFLGETCWQNQSLLRLGKATKHGRRTARSGFFRSRKMVAGVRSVNSRRHDEELFSLGTWRIEMRQAIKKYFMEAKEGKTNNLSFSAPEVKP